MTTEQKLKQFINKIIPVSNEFSEAIQNHLDNLTKPLGSLGILEDSVKKLGAIQQTDSPRIAKMRLYTFAGDHGIAQESVSAYPASVTPQMVLNFLHGGAAISVLAGQFNVEMKVVDVGVNYDFGELPSLIQQKVANGTKNFLQEPAMTREQALQSLFVGIELARKAKEEQVNLLIAGEMGIGNTTSSSAITSILCHKSIEEVTGIGTGVSHEGLKHKIRILNQALERRDSDRNDPLDVLA